MSRTIARDLTPLQCRCLQLLRAGRDPRTVFLRDRQMAVAFALRDLERRGYICRRSSTYRLTRIAA